MRANTNEINCFIANEWKLAKLKMQHPISSIYDKRFRLIKICDKCFWTLYAFSRYILLRNVPFSKIVIINCSNNFVKCKWFAIKWMRSTLSNAFCSMWKLAFPTLAYQRCVCVCLNLCADIATIRHIIQHS